MIHYICYGRIHESGCSRDNRQEFGMGDTGRKFRSAVGGYNKEDVNTYIKEADLQNVAKQEEMQKAIASLTEERDTLLEEKNTLLRQSEQQATELLTRSEEMETLRKQVEDLLARTEEQNTALEKLQAEKDSAEKIAADLTEELRLAKTAAEELERRLTEQKEMAETKYRELETALEAEKSRAEEEIASFKAAFTEKEDGTGYKIRMYDKISGQIGDILLGANRDADEILSNARAEADKMRMETADELEKNRSDLQTELDRIREDTKEEAANVRQKLSETAGTMLADISMEMHSNIDNCLKELATCMTEVEYDTETMLQTMQKRYREMNDRLQYYQSCVQEHVDSKLAELDQKYGIDPAGRKS